MGRRLLVAVLLALCGSGAASAQEEDFEPWTGEPEAPAPEQPLPPPPAPSPPPVEAPPPAAPAPRPAPLPPQRRAVREPRPEEFNRVSLYGAPTLGVRKPAVGVYLGFPLLGVKAGIGVHERVDVGLGFDSFYGVMNELRVFTRIALLTEGEQRWALSFHLEGGYAFFAQPPELETNGARWLTGRRNWNVEPGLRVSWRGETVQSARLFFDLRYHLALDTQPFSEDPLGGVPPPVVVGHNVPVRMGAEMPFSPLTSFLFMFGFDIHGRSPPDSPFMPYVSVGLVSGF